MAESKIAAQVGVRGFYAEVTLIAERVEHPNWIIEVEGRTDPCWQIGARFGIELLRSRLSGHAAPSYKIRVTNIKGQVGDTSVVTVAFAAYHALRLELKLQEPFDKGFVFEQKTGSFMLNGG